MPCIPPPQPQIEATITVGPAPDYALLFVPNRNDGSATYIDSNGNLDFSSFSCEITVKFTIATKGIVFYRGYGRDSISYAESMDPTELKQPVADGHTSSARGSITRTPRRSSNITTTAADTATAPALPAGTVSTSATRAASSSTTTRSSTMAAASRPVAGRLRLSS